MTNVKNQVLCFMGKEYSEKSSQVFCKNSSCFEFSPEFVAVRYFLLSVAPKCFIQMLGAKIVILDDFSRQNQSLLRRISRLELRNCRFLQNSFVALPPLFDCIRGMRKAVVKRQRRSVLIPECGSVPAKISFFSSVLSIRQGIAF